MLKQGESIGWLNDMADVTQTESQTPLASDARLDSIPPLLASVRDYVQEVLPLLVRSVFERADDALFELAEQAQIAAEQKIYFNAKKELRLKRRSIETSYLSVVRESFHARPQVASEDAKSDSEKILSSISIDDPMFRLFIVVDAMVDKANKRLQPLCEKINQQIHSLLPEYTIDQHNSPISLYVLTENFLRSCDCLQIEAEEKIIILNMYEKYILDDFDKVLNRIYRILLDGEIVNLANAKQQDEISENKKIKSTTTSKEKSKKNTDDFDNKEKLLNCLYCLQVEGLTKVDELALIEMAGVVKSAVQEVSIEAESYLAKELQQAIDLMRMLFTFILVENESIDLEKWLKQLYLPLLRAILIDVTVLSREGHAVRRLLSEIAKAAHDVNPDSAVEEDLFRRHIVNTIERVAREFDRDLSIFPELLVDFTSAVDDERKRQKIIRERLQVADPSADQLIGARAEVDKKIAKLCKGKKIPIEVIDFLNGPWKDVLSMRYVVDGAHSIQWSSALEVAEFIIDSTLAKNRGALKYQLAACLDIMRQELLLIGVSAAEIARFLVELETIHLQQYQAARERAQKRISAKPTILPPPESEETIPAIEALIPKETILDTVTIAAEAAADQNSPDENLMAARRCVDELKADMWLEYFPQTDQKIRVKIAAILPTTRKFVFVDRAGKKITEKSAEEVAVSIDSGELKLLDANSVFGKALSLKRES